MSESYLPYINVEVADDTTSVSSANCDLLGLYLQSHSPVLKPTGWNDRVLGHVLLLP